MSILNKQLSMPSLPSLQMRKPSRSARRTTTVTGLEIGATRAIAAHARLQGGQIVAERVAERQLPPGLMRDGLSYHQRYPAGIGDGRQQWCGLILACGR